MKGRARLSLVIAFFGLLFWWVEMHDQPLPQRAGEVLRRIEDATQLPVTELVEALTGSPLPKPQQHADSGVAVQQIMREELAQRQTTEEPLPDEKVLVSLKKITFKGANILGDRELTEQVSKYLETPMSYEQMLEIGMTVETYYRQNNYLARVILPPQDLSEGVLQLEVIESVISRIEVEQQLENLPNTQAHIQALIASKMPQGEYLNTKSIERGLALANNVPGVSVQASLKEGAQAGDTELLLKMYQSRTKDLDVTVDNAGSRSTGAYRMMASLNLFNANDMQDLFNLVGVVTRGSEYIRTAFSLPVGLDGWRMGANLSFMKYEVVVGDVGMVGAIGNAITRGLEWVYPLLRSDQASATVTINADTKDFKNTSAQGLVMSDYEAKVLSTQVAGYYRDVNPGGGSGTYLVQYSQGRINLDGSLSQATDATGPRTEGGFGKIRTALTWQQPLTTQTSAFVSYTAQLSNRNLDTSEKMQLGGINGVRAYPTGEGSGSDAQLVQLELRHALESGFTIAGLYDWGQVWQQHDPFYPGGPTNNHLTYKGYGASVSYTTSSGMTMKAIWARRQGDNPNPNPVNGRDQDGTYDRNRFWLQLNVPF